MKKLKAATLFVICVFIATTYANAIGLRSEFIDYKIEEINVNPSEGMEKVWKLTYNGGEKPVTVVKRDLPKGCAYVVNTDFFEVCYASTPKGFGTRTVKRSWSTVPMQINDAVINSNEVQKQQVILPGKVDDETALGLIASFLPNLLNDDYKHLLN